MEYYVIETTRFIKINYYFKFDISHWSAQGFYWKFSLEMTQNSTVKIQSKIQLGKYILEIVFWHLYKSDIFYNLSDK